MQPTPYDPKVPENAPDKLADSQPEIVNNFFQLFNIFMINHISLDATVDAGNHTNIQLKGQPNSQETDLSCITVYAKDDPTTTEQLFIRYQGNGQEFQLSCYQIYGLTPFPGSYIPFISYLPGRILIYFGVIIPGTLPNNTLPLYPPIAKNIISVSTCPAESAPPTPTKPANPNFKPWISLQKTPEGFYTGVTFNPSFQPPAPQFYYLILANI